MLNDGIVYRPTAFLRVFNGPFFNNIYMIGPNKNPKGKSVALQKKKSEML